MQILRSAPALLIALAAACTPARPSLAPAPATATGTVIAPAVSPMWAALDSIFDDSMFASAHWGVLVRSLESGETLYARNAGRMFVPASNMKLVTAAATLETLGPDYRYTTQIAATGPVRDGELRGDLVVIGSGDPSISDRFHGDAAAVFRAWADSLRAHGVTRITGAIVGNDDVFDDVPLGRGWAWDDLQDSYSAEIGGLELNEGFVTLRIAPVDGRVSVTAHPAAEGWVTVVTDSLVDGPAESQANVAFRRTGTATTVELRGSIPADTTFVEEEVAVRNNTAFFAAALRQALTEAGIAIGGASFDADDLPAARTAEHVVLFTHTSPPMSEILAAFLKPSQNQLGEILVKTLGVELRGWARGRPGWPSWTA